MKIVHLSDTHIAGYTLETFDKVTRGMMRSLRPAREYLIVITGDVQDYYSDTNVFRIMMRIEYLRAAGYKVFAVPGNHDLGVGVLQRERCLRRFYLSMYGRLVEFPVVETFGDITAIGLNTMAQELNWYDAIGADGELGEKQLKRLNDALLEVKTKHVVIAMHHDPFDTRFMHGLKDPKDFRRVVQGKSIDAILTGHTHLGDSRNGAWGVPRFYNGGTAIGRFPAKERGPFRVFDLDTEPWQDKRYYW